jgi:signal recognition particle subunit SRP54
MSDVMKAMGGAKRGPMAGLANMLGFGGGMPNAEEMAKLAEKMPGGLPPGTPGAPGLPPNMPGMPNLPKGLPPNFPGLPGGLPGLGPKFPGGFPGSGKKK